VHMAHIQYPLLGDALYGGRGQVPAAIDAALVEAIQGFRRQALHAERLSFAHPRSAESVSFEAPLAADFAALLELLKQYD
jgi:23S rRNA pseudouridine1911/1915/1917 synthase